MRRPRQSELYAATADIHAATEQVVERAGFFTAPARYGDYLRRLHVFYRRFEISAKPHGTAQLAAWRITDRIAWLGSDLESLAVSPIALSPPEQPPPTSLVLSAPPNVIGGLYVLVGSTLGAPILLRRARALDLPSSGGRAYLSGVASERCWPRFLDMLEAEPADAAPCLATGAIATFECLLHHLSGAPQ